VPENHFEEFIDSIEYIEPGTPIVIVGSSSGNLKFDVKLEKLLREHKNVTYLGHVNNELLLNELWCNSGVYFHGHSVGGTNPALVQAMASGATVVAFDSVFNREVLQNTGIFVSNVPKEMASVFNTLMNSPDKRKKLSKSAQERAADQYSWKQVVKAYEDLIDLTISSN
jgi:glycosyltransferase involved in cell wall biosynthesis